MKNIFKFLFPALLFAAAACTQTGPETINEITDHYSEPPQGLVLTSLTRSESVWSTDRRLFNLTFSGEGTTLETTLVGFGALLEPGQYVLAPEASAAIGNAISQKTKVNGTAASSGYITVGKKGSEYQVSAFVEAGDEQRVLSWTGALPFKADPDPTKLVQVLQAQSNLPNNVQTVTMQLATDGISSEFDWSTFQNVWKGEGGYLALDLYSEDGYLHEGTYVPCAAGGVVNPGEFGIGYDTQIEYGGTLYPMNDWGTCWWAVKDGAATATKILGGLVSVKKVDDGWQIAWGEKYPEEYVFTGAIPALTKPSGGGSVSIDYEFTEEIQDVYAQDYSVVAGVKKHCVTVTDKSGGVAAYLELLLADGDSNLEGSYISTEYASAPGQLANGYYLDFSAMGWGIIEGGSYYVADGEKVYIEAGQTVEVKKLAEGAYEFIGSGFDFAAAGEGYVPGDGGDDSDMTRLTQFLSLTSYVGYGTMLVGVELATDGITYSPADYAAGKWFATYEGSGNYIKLEVYSTDGNVAPGTYTPCAEAGSVKEGEFGIGYFSTQWNNAAGSTWYTVTDGTPDAGAYVTDGTVTITKDGDEYTIVIDSSTVKAKYVGKLQ